MEDRINGEGKVLIGKNMYKIVVCGGEWVGEWMYEVGDFHWLIE